MRTSHLGLQDWKKIFTYPFTIHVTKYPAIQWFQSCINHNILVTNSYLFKIKLRNNQDCYYCLSQEETITLVLASPNMQRFLKSLENWLKLQNIECDMNEDSFMFGINKKIKHFQKYSASSCYMQNTTYILLGATSKIFGHIQECTKYTWKFLHLKTPIKSS